MQTYVPGRDSILGVVGPLAHSRRDIELFMRTVLSVESAPWERDPGLLEMPWRQEGARRGGWEGGERKLRVGVMLHDGEVRPTKPVERALKDAVEKLRSSGEVELVDFEPWGTREGWNLARQLVSSLRQRHTTSWLNLRPLRSTLSTVGSAFMTYWTRARLKSRWTRSPLGC